ncbi:MAG TPA: hypothetical protein PKY58_04305 [Syntrophales bacterium]|nr:hypothetical protein [Syntrophales bacterium]HQB29912.1 hypothetical protein [Syntrophales bacterium]HQQ26726.1 hypothetical protein [Syntrophales bacterium]
MIESKVATDELMDRRIVEKKIREGSIQGEVLDDYRRSLPDLCENAEEIVIGREE